MKYTEKETVLFYYKYSKFEKHLKNLNLRNCDYEAGAFMVLVEVTFI